MTNFERTLPRPDSDLARESLKGPYKLGSSDLEMRLKNALPRARWLSTLKSSYCNLVRGSPLSVGKFIWRSVEMISSSIALLPLEAALLRGH